MWFSLPKLMIFLRMCKGFISYIKSFKIIQRKISLFFIISNFFLSGFVYTFGQDEPFTVVLDAGHGGHDSGNRGNGYYEKKIALNIALKIGKKLEKIKGFNVIYTRKSDVFVELIQRANIANKADADLFISIHCDAFSSSKVFGAGTFVLGLHENERNFKVAQKENSVIFLEENYQKNYDGFNPNDPESVISLLLMQQTYLDQSIIAANSIQKSFVSNLKRKDRTVKQAGFVVLKYTYMPSVLVETGFLTNSSEGAYLNSSKGQSNMADALAKAIVNYRDNRNASFQKTSAVNEPKKIEKSNKLNEKLVFKIQIAASKKKIDLKPYNFKGLKSISRTKNERLFRYYYGSSSNYEKAKKLLRFAKNQGFKNAFIVPFLGTRKISITEALTLLK